MTKENKQKKIVGIVREILWIIIYLFAIWKAGFWNGIIIGVLAVVYGLLNYYAGGEYVQNLHNKFL